jgi:hypothetical protein
MIRQLMHGQPRHQSLRTTFVLLAAIVGPASVASAADLVFQDHFNNGSPTDSDTTPGFWTTRLSGSTSTAVEPVGGPLALTAGGSQFPHAQLASNTQAMFNFFHTPILIQASGLNFNLNGGAPSSQALFRLALSSRTLVNNDDSEYLCDDAFALRIESPTSGTGPNFAMGVKENYPMHNTEYDGFWLVNPLNNFGAVFPGAIRGFSLLLGPRFYDLTISYDTSPSDPTQQTRHFAGSLDMFLNNWHDSTDPGPVTGDTAMFLQSQMNNNPTANTANLSSFTVSQIKQSWLKSGDGNWSDASAWSDSSFTRTNQDQSQVTNIPDYLGANVRFGATGGPHTITADMDMTLGAMVFDSPDSYTINAGVNVGTIHLATRWLNNEITVLGGSHTINAPVWLYNDTAVSVAAGSTLTMPIWQPGGELPPGAPINVSMSGGGTLNVGNVRFTSLAVNGGTVKVLPGGASNDPAGTSKVKTLSFAGGPATPTARLDLTNNSAVIDYDTTTPLSDVRSLLRAGFGGGLWNGNGITSSWAAAAAVGAHKTALGYGESSTVLGASGGTFAGQSVDGTAVLLKYTLSGDANLDGKVDTLDFNSLAASFGGSGKFWTQADFNYDGTVDTLDFNSLAANFGGTIAGDAGGAGSAGSAGSAGALVPEPAAMLASFVTLAGLVVARRRLGGGG